MANSGYRLVIFDFDGTLANSFPFFLEVFDTLADAHGFKRLERDKIEMLRGYDVREMLAHVGLPLWKAPRVAMHFKSLMGESIGRIPLFADARATLEALSHAGVTLAVVSSNATANVKMALGPEHARLVGHYECGVALLGKRPRLRRILARSGVAREEVLCVGDEMRDIDAAQAEGMASGAVTWGYAAPEALMKRKPTVMFSSFDEIVRCVRGQL